jgi:hypothetical protein
MCVGGVRKHKKYNNGMTTKKIGLELDVNRIVQKVEVKTRNENLNLKN